MQPVYPVCVALVAAVLLAAPVALGAPGSSQSFSLAKFGTSQAGRSKALVANAAGTFDLKIIGGLKSSIQKFPFMASISILIGKKWEQQCGATILNKNHILTAGHCFSNRNVKVYRVRVGSDWRLYKGQVVGIAQIAVHPKFNSTTLDYDVAVVKLSKSLSFSSSVQPVKLVPAKAAIKANTNVFLVGWGYTQNSHDGGYSAVLRSVIVQTIATSECIDDYAEYNLAVTKRNFCGMTSDKDSCEGDSGGPVIIQGTNQQQGIVSWGMGCALMGNPGVWINVAEPEIRSFINSEMNKK